MTTKTFSWWESPVIPVHYGKAMGKHAYPGKWDIKVFEVAVIKRVSARDGASGHRTIYDKIPEK